MSQDITETRTRTRSKGIRGKHTHTHTHLYPLYDLHIFTSNYFPAGGFSVIRTCGTGDEAGVEVRNLVLQQKTVSVYKVCLVCMKVWVCLAVCQ